MSPASDQMSELRQVMSAWYLCFVFLIGLVVLGEVAGLDHLSQIESNSASRLDQTLVAQKEICVNLPAALTARELRA